MRNIIKSILCIMVIGTASGCDNLYNGITDELYANYFHGTRQFIANDGAAGDQFGYSVAVSADGNTVAAGAPYDDSSRGAVYAYRWNGSSWTGIRITAIARAASDDLGWSVAVSYDGNVIVAGSLDSGKVWIFRWSGAAYEETSLSGSGNFGYGVSVSGDGETVIAGAYDYNSSQGAVYAYRRNGSSYAQTQILTADDGSTGDQFGYSVALSADGSTIVSGANQEDGSYTNQGAVYVYRLNGSSYAQMQKLKSDDGAANDWFGSSVSVSGDGRIIASGSYYDDSGRGGVYVFRLYNSTYSQAQKLLADDGLANDYFGYSVSVSKDGSAIVAGADIDDINGTNQGSAYLFCWNGTSYALVRKYYDGTGEGGDNFGKSVSVSHDGAAVVVGVNCDDMTYSDQGSAWIFAE